MFMPDVLDMNETHVLICSLCTMHITSTQLVSESARVYGRH